VAGGAPARVLRVYDFERNEWVKREHDDTPHA